MNKAIKMNERLCICIFFSFLINFWYSFFFLQKKGAKNIKGLKFAIYNLQINRTWFDKSSLCLLTITYRWTLSSRRFFSFFSSCHFFGRNNSCCLKKKFKKNVKESKRKILIFKSKKKCEKIKHSLLFDNPAVIKENF